jgi:hypothetical protein
MAKYPDLSKSPPPPSLVTLRANPPSPLLRRLEALRPKLAAAAQKVYDAWEVDEDGFDGEVGTGGVCDQVAEAMHGVIDFDDVTVIDGGHDGDDHAFLIVYDDRDAFAVDIPPGVYETGGGYDWKKIPDVTIDGDDVEIYPVRRSDVAELEANPPPPPKPLRAPPPKKLPPKDKEETDEEIYQREFWKKELWDLEHEGMEDNPSQPRRMAHGAADALLNANKAAITAYVQNVLCLHLTSKAAAKSVPFQRAIQLLPKVAAGKRTAHQHYGCGVYGCVMPTSVAGVVVKVTSDPSEPELVDLVKSRLKHWPEGLAAYYGTLKLPETYRGRPTFVLWREEAFHVGELEKLIHESTPAKARPLIALRRRLLQHLHYAAYARYTLKKSSYAPALLKDAEQLLPWARTTVRWADIEEATDQESDVLEEHRGARKLALCLVASQLISEMMVSDCGLAGAAIGKAFVQLRGVGILLADVHDSNIGVVDGRWVITDPGHAVVLR